MYQTAVRRLFVTAIVRHPERVPQLDCVIAKGCDLNRVDDLASVLKDHDVVISSVHFLDDKADKLRAGQPAFNSERCLGPERGGK
jgi:putative NADH-flavin reductase